MARLVFALWVVAIALVGAQPSPSDEYAVKEAFLYNFLKYVEWPKTSKGPIDVCVAGQNPFGQSFFETMSGRLDGREIKGRAITEPQDTCSVVFVPRTASGAYVREARGKPILLVGETPDFLKQGGIINFVPVDGKLGFEIDAEAAIKAKIPISPSLLRLRRVSGQGAK